MKPQLKTGQMKMFSEHQVTQLIRLYEDKLRSMQKEIQAMKAKRSSVRLFQEFNAPEPPNVLEEAVKEQQRRGLRP